MPASDRCVLRVCREQPGDQGDQGDSREQLMQRVAESEIMKASKANFLELSL